MANFLAVRILQPKTRQSDGFLQILGNMTFEVNWGEISTNYWRFELLMDNWAVCNIISPTVFAKYKEELAKIKAWSKSSHVKTKGQHNGTIIRRDVISDLHTTEFRMMLSLMIKVMQEIPEGSDIVFLTNAA